MTEEQKEKQQQPDTQQSPVDNSEEEPFERGYSPSSCCATASRPAGKVTPTKKKVNNSLFYPRRGICSANICHKYQMKSLSTQKEKQVHLKYILPDTIFS